MCYNITVPTKGGALLHMKKFSSIFYDTRNIKDIWEIDNPEDTNDLALLGRALSAPVRIQILRLINRKNMLASEIAEQLNLPLSSAIFHLKILEEAQLVTKEYSTKRKGTLHWYTYATQKTVTIRMRTLDGESPNKILVPYTQEINIGDYIDADFSPNCGIATEREHIMENQPNKAFLDGRHEAQIIWSHGYGSLTYALPNEFALRGALSEINFSLEICSEARGFNTNYPSDITFSINEVELCTFISPGDYGDRYGKFTPPWWFSESTKYGLLTTVSIREQGVFLNEKLVNKKINLDALKLTEGKRMTLRIEVKKDAEHTGGFNLFGDKFGDYNQSIVFTAVYKRND